MTIPIHDNVSVVLPAFDSEETILRAVNSVFAQTLRPREVIVVDDGSRIPVANVLSRFGDRVRIIRQPNAGAAQARNAGIRAARCDWIAFLDADDEWLPKRLEAQGKALARHPDVGFCFGAFHRRVVDEGTDTLMDPNKWADRRLILSPAEAFHVSYRIQTSVVLARRDLLLEAPFDPSLRTAEDRDVWIRLFLRTAAFGVSEPLAVHYEHLGSLSNSDFDGDARNMLAVIARYRGLLGPEETRQREADVYCRWAGVLVAAGRSSSALAPAWQYLKRAPSSPKAWYVAGRTLAGVAAHPGQRLGERMRVAIKAEGR